MAVNWGTFGGWAGAVLAGVTSIGYFIAGDIRRGLYFLFACAITLTIVWK